MSDQRESTRSSPPESAREVVWRETFVSRFDDVEDAEAVRRFGDFLMTLCFEGGYLGRRDKNLIVCQVEAVAADLTHLVAFLREVAEHPEHSEASRLEFTLCQHATTWAERLEAMAEEVRETVTAEEKAQGAAPTLEDEAQHLLAELRRLLALALKLRLQGPPGHPASHAADALSQAVKALEVRP